MKHALILFVVLLACLPRAAHAAPTCDGNQPETCCEWWVIEITLDNKKWGAMLEHGYPQLMKRRDSELDSSLKMCQYYRGLEAPGAATRAVTHRICDSRYSAPKCAGAAGVRKQFFKDIVHGESWPAIHQGLREWIAGALEKLGQYSNTIKKMRQAYDAVRIGPDGSGNKYLGIGGTLLDYGNATAEATSRVHDLERQLNTMYSGELLGLYEGLGLNTLQYAGGKYGSQERSPNLLDIAAALGSVIDGLGVKVNSLVPTLGLAGFEKPRVDFLPGADKSNQLAMGHIGEFFKVHVNRVRNADMNCSEVTMDTIDSYWSVECFDGKAEEVYLLPNRPSRVCGGSSVATMIFKSTPPREPRPVPQPERKCMSCGWTLKAESYTVPAQ